MNTCISCCGPCGSLTPARLFVQAFFVTQKYHHTHLYYDLLILDTWTAKNLCERFQLYKDFVCTVK